MIDVYFYVLQKTNPYQNTVPAVKMKEVKIGENRQRSITLFVGITAFKLHRCENRMKHSIDF